MLKVAWAHVSLAFFQKMGLRFGETTVGRIAVTQVLRVDELLPLAQQFIRSLDARNPEVGYNR